MLHHLLHHLHLQRSKDEERKKLEPKRRRKRTVIPWKKEPLPYKHKYEVHHIKFQRHGGTDDEHNLVKLTPEEHHALHNKADFKLRQANGIKVMSRKGHATKLAQRRQEIHRKLVGEKEYSSYMSQMAKKRWEKARNGKKATIQYKKAA